METAIDQLVIRPALVGDYPRVGQLCVESYTMAGTAHPNDDYLMVLRDVAGRVDRRGSSVLVASLGAQVVGTVSICPFGSPLTEVCEQGEFEFRMLAVDTGLQRQGIATLLIEAAENTARELGLVATVACATTHNATAHQLYNRMGFLRRPDRDWIAPDGTELATYLRAIGPVLQSPEATRYCTRCGEPKLAGNHATCQVALGLEPPRYCTQCRRRMVVQVFPAGWRATCKEHGSLSRSVG